MPPLPSPFRSPNLCRQAELMSRLLSQQPRREPPTNKGLSGRCGPAAVGGAGVRRRGGELGLGVEWNAGSLLWRGRWFFFLRSRLPPPTSAPPLTPGRVGSYPEGFFSVMADSGTAASPDTRQSHVGPRQPTGPPPADPSKGILSSSITRGN